MRRFCSVVCVSLAFAVLAIPLPSKAQVICISNVSPPPELPVYEQPPIPEPGYLWSPGYWGSGPNGYFWVPGTWVQPPAVGLLWTPGYWGWRDGIYVWNAGYWGPHIGFYGGVNYGFGYTGVGYEGGRWENGVFAYNRTVNNFGGVTITNVYEKTVIVEPGAARVSFNGGSGGIAAQPSPAEQAAAHEQHVAAVPSQLQHERTASANTALLASENHGHPAIAATAKPGEFTGKGVVAARQVTPATAPSGVQPAGAAAVSKITTGATPPVEKPNPSSALAKPPNNNPAGVVAPGSNPTGSGTSDKKEPTRDHAKLNGGSPPSKLNTNPKPSRVTTPPQAAPPNPPATAAAIKPPPPPSAKPNPSAPAAATIKPSSAAPSRPAAKPACPPGKTMTPSGCK